MRAKRLLRAECPNPLWLRPPFAIPCCPCPQVSQYESLVEEATHAREDAVAQAAQLRQQITDISNDLQASAGGPQQLQSCVCRSVFVHTRAHTCVCVIAAVRVMMSASRCPCSHLLHVRVERAAEQTVPLGGHERTLKRPHHSCPLGQLSTHLTQPPSHTRLHAHALRLQVQELEQIRAAAEAKSRIVLESHHIRM